MLFRGCVSLSVAAILHIQIDWSLYLYLYKNAHDSADAFAASAFAPTSHGIESSMGTDWRDHASADPLSSRPRSISASCEIRAAPTRVQRLAGSAERETIPRADL